IIMTPNDGYQKSILPFNPITDLLGRIDDSMIYEYIKDLPLQVVEIQHVNSLATFNSLYEYFMFLYAIGSLQKIFNYKGEYEYALKLITVFKNLFSKEETLSVDFNYSYITLKKK
ncbi:MAG: class I SAM-dependent methyltransferase, partial [Clostridium saudiense]|nr:class I SAM-dependent methyltransferase [Clostridium saudiense]